MPGEPLAAVPSRLSIGFRAWRFRLGFALGAVLAAFALQPAPAAAETPFAYRLALQRILVAAQAAERPGLSSLADDRTVAEQLIAFEAIREVTAPSGVTVAVDNSDVGDLLRGSRAEGQRAIGRLRTLIAALDAASAAEDWTHDANARALLEATLARSEFQGDGPNRVGLFFDDLRNRLFRWLEGIFPGIHISSRLSGPLGRTAEVVFYLLAVGCLIFAIAFFGFNWRSARHNLARYAALPGHRLVSPDDPAAALRGAEEAAAAADYRRAVHFLYLWALLRLSAQSRFRYDRSLTNREQWGTVQGGGELRDITRSIVDTFDRVWYGHESCGPDDYHRFRGAIDRLVEVAV